MTHIDPHRFEELTGKTIEQYVEEEEIPTEPEEVLEEGDQFNNYEDVLKLGYDLVKIVGGTHKFAYGYIRAKASYGDEHENLEIEEVMKINSESGSDFHIPEKYCPSEIESSETSDSSILPSGSSSEGEIFF